MVTSLHARRLETVVTTLCRHEVSTVLDLGCGHAELMVLLAAEHRFKRIVGIDSSAAALQTATERLTMAGHSPGDGRSSLFQGSFTTVMEGFNDFDAATLIETIEHVPPHKLSAVEQTVFDGYRPRIVIITTPNSEYNVLHGIRPGRLRHRGHMFEWTREKFQSWCTGIAERREYQVEFSDVGEVDATHGASSQMAVFLRGKR